MNNGEVVHNTKSFVKNRLEGESTGHDWWHVERVTNIAGTIHEAEGGDWLVIELALLLHDIGDRKVIMKIDDDYTIAEAFLISQDVPTELITKIMNIIKTMSFSKSLDGEPEEKSIEHQIVQDADRLDALGAIGVARAFAFGGSRGRPLYDPTYEAQNFTSTEAYKNAAGSTLHHFEEKLFKLKDLLNTQAAKTIADERDAFMRQFVKQFLDEWNGDK
ncbi:MAG TPA: HD domain-containing protein [Candidatus Microsaccharimonas sp.]|jgi:uncharacterized protein